MTSLLPWHLTSVHPFRCISFRKTSAHSFFPEFLTALHHIEVISQIGKLPPNFPFSHHHFVQNGKLQTFNFNLMGWQQFCRDKSEKWRNGEDLQKNSFSSESPQSSKVNWKFLHSNDKFYEWLIQISTCPLNIAVVNQSISCECNFRFDTLGINTKY